MIGSSVWRPGMREVAIGSLAPRASGFPDFATLVEPAPLRSLACHVIAPFVEPRGWSLAQASALFDHVKRNVRYDAMKAEAVSARRPTTIFRPTHTLDVGQGICSDQAVLLASLLAAVYIPSTLLVVETPVGPNLLTAVPVGQLTAAQVGDAVRQSRGTANAQLRPWVFPDVGWPSTFADTAAGNYLGDYETQVRLGTIFESGGCAYWRRIISTYRVQPSE